MRETTADQSGGDALLAAYDTSLPYVYGYLLARCRQPAVAEDLTSETFLAAVDAVRRDSAPELSTPWLIGVARHKLADHWREALTTRGRRPSTVSSPGRHSTSSAHCTAWC